VSERRPTVVAELEPGQGGHWDRFVEAHPEATFFHKSAWKPVIERGFGQRVVQLAAWRADELVGVLPLVYLRNRLFPRALVSTAFCVYGGPVARDPRALQALDQAAVELGERLGVRHVEYRGGGPASDGWVARGDLYATFRKAIDPDQDANLKAIPRKQRAVVRKALNGDLTVATGDDARLFHSLYATSVHNHGTPVFSRRYVDALLEAFPTQAREIRVIRSAGTPVAGLLSFYFREGVLPYYAGGTPEGRGLGAHDLMYWTLMRDAAARGCRTFDFGRSKTGTGAYAFKKNWGFEPDPLTYHYKLIRGSEVPDTTPANPKYARAIAAWRRLPLWLANRIGPPIARELG
jgi:FemAB-related protein (PEP-CTERM system-associated)